MRLILVALLLFGWTPAALAQEFPALTGRVVDAANILPPEVEQRIEQRSALVEEQTTSQIVVATIPDLQGYDIADFGYRLGRHWGIGQKDTDNGVLLIVAPNERRVRVEVGYGLEPVLTDALSSVIIQTQILPHFRAGDLPGGTEAGFNAIANQFELPPEEAAANVRAAREAQSARGQPRGEMGIGGAILTVVVILFFVCLLHGGGGGKGGGGGRGRRRRGVAPIILFGPGMGGGFGGGGFGGGGFGGGFGGGGGGFGGGGASGGW
ncbi:MAG: TPM domain-containing protein [Sphingomonadaceae bacterium]